MEALEGNEYLRVPSQMDETVGAKKKFALLFTNTMNEKCLGHVSPMLDFARGRLTGYDYSFVTTSSSNLLESMNIPYVNCMNGIDEIAFTNHVVKDILGCDIFIRDDLKRDAQIRIFARTVGLMPFLCSYIESKKPDLIIYDAGCQWVWACINLPHFAKIPRACWVTNLHNVVLLAALEIGEETLRDERTRMVSDVAREYMFAKYKLQLPKSVWLAKHSTNNILPIYSNWLSDIERSRLRPPEFYCIGCKKPSLDEADEECSTLMEQLHEQRLAGKFVIYVTFGTVVPDYATNIFLDMMKKIMAAFGNDDSFFVVVSVGGERKFSETPQNFLVKRTVQQKNLLSAGCFDLMICHGGWNTLQEGLHYKTPMLIIPPPFADQPFNARWLSEKGWAQELTTDFTVSELRASCLSILTSSNSKHPPEGMYDDTDQLFA